LTGEWYYGDEVNCPYAPSIDHIQFPADFCGAVDMGIDAKGQLTLVEVNHPFACGWYGRTSGKDIETYATWLYYGWEYMLRTC